MISSLKSAQVKPPHWAVGREFYKPRFHTRPVQASRNSINISEVKHSVAFRGAERLFKYARVQSAAPQPRHFQPRKPSCMESGCVAIDGSDSRSHSNISST